MANDRDGVPMPGVVEAGSILVTAVMNCSKRLAQYRSKLTILLQVNGYGAASRQTSYIPMCSPSS